ncbi:hypothetical protein EMCRGX_G007190 [Ephydatia muelleri]
MAKQRKEWLVRWKGFGHDDDTWEPLEHLSGCEQYIARFEEERDRKQAEDDDARGQKRKRRDDDEEAEVNTPVQRKRSSDNRGDLVGNQLSPAVLVR